MTAGGNAFDDSLNNFNHSMNWGYRLLKWFVREFGSTQCQAITQCNFPDPAGLSSSIERDCLTQCKLIAGKCAEKVEGMLAADSRRRVH